MTLKDINFSVDMYGTTAISASTYPVVYTGDEASANVRFTVTDEPTLTGATAIAHLYFADSHHIVRDLTLNGLVFNYTLVGTENDHAGIVRADIIITLNGAKYTRAGYKFRVDTSLEASKPLVEYAVDTLDTLVDGAEEWLLQAQTDFGAAQGARAAEWVADNDTRDDAFAAAQASRATVFGASEAERTSTFNTNETSRSNTFTTNENARQAAADSGELARDASYMDAEANRDSQFTATEAIRSDQEAGRVSAESARVAAESARVTEYSGLATDLTATLAAADTNIENFDIALQTGIIGENIATKLTDLQTTYAPRLLSAEQQLEQTLNKSAITLTHMFADNAARDAYFVAHPTELMEQLFIKVGTGYQQYLEGAWQASAAIVTEQLSATNQPITDTGNYFATDNTNAALQELGAHKASLSNPHGVTKTQVGLGNVDNTSDANKPISVAMQTALDLKANKVQEAWITPTFINGWGEEGTTLKYFKDEFGIVHVQGTVFPNPNGASSGIMFYFTPNYRSDGAMGFVSSRNNNNVSACRILSDGRLETYGARTERHDFSITFKAV